MSMLSDVRETMRRDEVWSFMAPPPSLDLDISHGPILYLEELNVSFDGFKAINDLTLYIDAGELRCIIGPNGAGKTTMMDIITGKTRPDSGKAFFGQRIDLLKLSEPQIATAGIGRKFQKPTVFEFHRVIDNLELALHAEKGVWPTLFAKLTSEQQDYLDETLDVIGLKEQRNAMAGSLSHGQKQWLEIGMLLVQQPHLLRVQQRVDGRGIQRVTDRVGGYLANQGLLVVLFPSLRLGITTFRKPRTWIPFIGWTARNRQLERRLARFFSLLVRTGLGDGDPLAQVQHLLHGLPLRLLAAAPLLLAIFALRGRAAMLALVVGGIGRRPLMGFNEAGIRVYFDGQHPGVKEVVDEDPKLGDVEQRTVARIVIALGVFGALSNVLTPVNAQGARSPSSS